MYRPSSLWILVLLKVIESCPSDYFKASEDTCLHLAQPTSRIPKEEYCHQKDGELFGRPLTPDMKDPLANAIARAAAIWIPDGAYVGMERTSRNEFGKNDDTWVFVDEKDNPFLESQYTVWKSFPIKGKDCGIVRLESEFYVVPMNCIHSFALLCEKDELPCESPNLYYSNYDGRCLAVLKDYKSYEKGLTSCPDGHLMKVKNESDLEEVVQAFFNGRFFGGIYIGLEKKNGKWRYING
ncbi:hypothetical protein CDAR_504221 [Caerostris darwini]|uniref:Uncharacterized protein n=1 Tax=Caerostris darwini TaxID=1538125 RepID=A0AAV4S3E5_9ARAC|nr:hypothetical protein CDAR_504221 [Caerostris darwini]